MDKLRLRASQIGGCPRRIVLEHQGVEGLPLWSGTERAFEDGRMHELHILEWAQQSLRGGKGRIIARQKEVVVEGEGVIVVGHIDGLLHVPGEGRWLVEAKALSHRAYVSAREEGISAFPQYYDQVQIYLEGLRQTRLRAAGAYLVVRNKQTPRDRNYDHLVLEVSHDPDRVSDLLSRAEEIAVHLREESLPDAPYHPDEDWHCQPPWCPYTYVCWPEWERQRPDTDIPELSELLSRRVELVGQKREIEDELRNIDEALKALQPGEYRADGYVLTVSVRLRESIDTRLLRQELGDEIQKYVRTTEYKTINIEEV